MVPVVSLEVRRFEVGLPAAGVVTTEGPLPVVVDLPPSGRRRSAAGHVQGGGHGRLLVAEHNEGRKDDAAAAPGQLQPPLVQQDGHFCSFLFGLADAAVIVVAAAAAAAVAAVAVAAFAAPTSTSASCAGARSGVFPDLL